MSTERQLPHSIEAEECLLSICLIDGSDGLGLAMGAGITASSFYDTKHGTVFDRMVAMLAEGKAIDQPTLGQELKTARELDRVGGWAFLTQISQQMPTTARASYFAAKVRELQTLREAIKQATAIVERCHGYSGGGVDAEIGPYGARLLSVLAGHSSKEEKDWPGVIEEAKAQATAICTPADKSRRVVSLGWPSLDAAFEPMRPGQLVVIGARPSVGKSSLLRPIAYGAARAGQHVYFPTLEVKPWSVAMQMAASVTGIGVRRLGKAHPREQKEFHDTLESFKAFPIHVGSTRRSLAAITAKARSLHAKKPLDVILIDYLTLISDCTIGDHKPSAIGRVTNALKALAVELDCPVVIAAQLVRASEKENNREPKLSDLKDSGDIEQDADKVIFIHRPDVDPITGIKQSSVADKDEVPTFFQNLIQAKGRDDGTGLASFYFKRETATFIPARKN